MKKTFSRFMKKEQLKKSMFTLLAFFMFLLSNAEVNAQQLSVAEGPHSATDYALVSNAEAPALLNASLIDFKQSIVSGDDLARKSYVVVELIINKVRLEDLTLEDAIDTALDESFRTNQVEVRNDVFDDIINIVKQ